MLQSNVSGTCDDNTVQCDWNKQYITLSGNREEKQKVVKKRKKLSLFSRVAVAARNQEKKYRRQCLAASLSFLSCYMHSFLSHVTNKPNADEWSESAYESLACHDKVQRVSKVQARFLKNKQKEDPYRLLLLLLAYAHTSTQYKATHCSASFHHPNTARQQVWQLLGITECLVTC